MGKRRLKDRRTIIVRFYSLLVILGLSVLFGGAAYGLYRPEVRIDSISVSGADIVVPRTVGEKVEEVLAGSYFYIFPKDSIFLISEEDVREKLLAEFPRVKTVSVEKTGFNSIEVVISEREPVFMWCSAATSTPCVLSDNNGFLFAQSNKDLTPIYGELAHDAPEIGNTIFEEGAVTKVDALTKALSKIGQEVESISFRDADEVVLVLAAGPRLEYVLGEEDQIAEAFPSVLEGISDLAEVQYIDMRFGKRVYIKRNE